ncbi:hypothetical protein A2U01_0058827, partial [Trifolium medium]|nr:hypothetical protein [Trifolium medium]
MMMFLPSVSSLSLSRRLCSGSFSSDLVVFVNLRFRPCFCSCSSWSLHRRFMVAVGILPESDRSPPRRWA